MNYYKLLKSVLSSILICLSFGAVNANAADYKDGDLHKNDYGWLQLNLMQSVDAKLPYNIKNDTYLETEFGARYGVLDLYGYVDIFDIFDRKHDDRYGGDNFFAKISPRISLDGLFQSDLSFGAVKELYIANVNNIGDRELFEQYLGIGADVDVPWFGMMGMNVYARYVRENYNEPNEGKWDGYMYSTSWSKPIYQFSDQSTINYQGYFDYQFGANKITNNSLYSNNAIEWYNGFYLHTDHMALGYGLKYFHNMSLIKNNSGAGKTSGIGHYFSVSYKF
ncbi:hypothetical protein GQ595_00015 [Gilliamella sp. Pra-s54]|nr:hypothetical protein [Gilliamella sp. Pra-s60]MWP28283.1 hypothetical protein [Gilliamella sp. Pra-s54]